MLTDNIAYCGVDCSACSDFTLGKCPGCRLTDWREGDICMPVECCRKQAVSCCGECPSFPCGDIRGFYSGSESHEQAFNRMRALQKE